MTLDLNITRDTLCQLAEVHGVQTHYTDIWGNRFEVSDEALGQILSALGVSLHTTSQCSQFVHAKPIPEWLEPTQVIFQGKLRTAEAMVLLYWPKAQQHEGSILEWTLMLEAGERHTGYLHADHLQRLGETDTVITYGFVLPQDVAEQIPLGYHTFSVHGKVMMEHGLFQPIEMAFIVVPEHCYLPPAFEHSETQNNHSRLFGPAVQVYGLRSERNWGMGDFTDLKNLLIWTAQQGGDLVGVNPLHSLFPNNPAHISPYSPSSRTFFNSLYLDIEAIEDFQESPTTQAVVRDPAFQNTLAELRAEEHVDYVRVAALKRPVLEALFQSFQVRHLHHNTRRAKAFEVFVWEGGSALKNLALYEALQEHFQAQDAHIWGWPVWPEAYQNPNSQAVRDFERDYSDRIQFFTYLQWQAALQLQAIKDTARRYEMTLGLYTDLAVGVDRGGADVWANQSLFALGASVGAPPDEHNQKGQDWGLPPMLPQKLREQAYQPFAAVIRENMRYAGALRMDHVMGLLRLYWVPPGMSAAEGGYVSYPFEDLLGILALESHRNRCMVIGEDLGTVPDGFREAMADWRVFSYKVLYFEKDASQAFKPAEVYPAHALVSLSTHDLATLNGFWTGHGLDVRNELNLFPNDEVKFRSYQGLDSDRWALMRRLQEDGLYYDEIPMGEPVPTGFACAVHRFLAQTPSQLMVFQFEDILGEINQANLPGTTDQHPNWQQKLRVPLEVLDEDPRLQVLMGMLHEVRGLHGHTASSVAC